MTHSETDATSFENETQGSKKASQAGTKPQFSSLETGARFPQALLNIGFIFALLISMICLFLSAYYLFSFLTATNSGLEKLIDGAAGNLQSATLEVAITGRLLMARLALTSCGIFVGISFGFLGFALVLLGIRKEIDAAARFENLEMKFARLSPGVLIIICATILIGICVTREIQFGYDISERGAIPSKDIQRATPTPSPSLPPITNDNRP